MNAILLENTKTIVIIGASSGIANAIASEAVKAHLTTTNNDQTANGSLQIVTISRSDNAPKVAKQLKSTDVLRHCHIQSDYSSNSIEQICQQLTPLKGNMAKVFICNGRLHEQAPKSDDKNHAASNSSIFPEKRLEDFNPESMQALFQSNTIVPMLWLQHLVKVVKGSQECIITVLSARVGSISDNQLGGWYSYRASKAALNMLIKSTAIEYARRAKNVKLIAFHPGTTDTPLSKPFQNNVPDGKLFDAEFVAQQLLSIHQQLVLDGEAEFIDWQGKTVTW